MLPHSHSMISSIVVQAKDLQWQNKSLLQPMRFMLFFSCLFVWSIVPGVLCLGRPRSSELFTTGRYSWFIVLTSRTWSKIPVRILATVGNALKLASEPLYIHLLSLIFTPSTLYAHHLSKRLVITLFFGIHPLCNEVLGWNPPFQMCSHIFICGIVMALHHKKPVWIFPAPLSPYSLKPLVTILCLLALYENRKILLCALLIISSSVFQWLVALVFHLNENLIGDYRWCGYGVLVFFLLSHRCARYLDAPIFEIMIGGIVPVFAFLILRTGTRQERLGALIWVLAPLIAFLRLPLPIWLQRDISIWDYLECASPALLRVETAKSWALGSMLMLICVPIHYQRALAWKNDVNLATAATDTTSRIFIHTTF